MSCDFLRCSRPLQGDGTPCAAVNYQRWQLLKMTNLCQLLMELRDRPNGLVIETWTKHACTPDRSNEPARNRHAISTKIGCR